MCPYWFSGFAICQTIRRILFFYSPDNDGYEQGECEDGEHWSSCTLNFKKNTCRFVTLIAIGKEGQSRAQVCAASNWLTRPRTSFIPRFIGRERPGRRLTGRRSGRTTHFPAQRPENTVCALGGTPPATPVDAQRRSRECRLWSVAGQQTTKDTVCFPQESEGYSVFHTRI